MIISDSVGIQHPAYSGHRFIQFLLISVIIPKDQHAQEPVQIDLPAGLLKYFKQFRIVFQRPACRVRHIYIDFFCIVDITHLCHLMSPVRGRIFFFLYILSRISAEIQGS